MRYLITGGAGFIGSHIAEELSTRHNVVILDNLFSGKMENIQPLLNRDSVQFIQGDIRDFNLLRDIFQDIDGIFHQAAITSVPRSLKDPLATNEVNITGTMNVLVAARDAGVKKVVYASSSSVYGDTPILPKQEDMHPRPKSPYATSKLVGEYYLRNFSDLYGLQGACLRYFNVFGPRQDPNSEYAAVIPRFITRALAGEPLTIYGDGKQTRDFTYIKDVVQANIKAMESSAEGVFNVAYQQRTSLLELAHLIMLSTGREVPVVHEPPRAGDVRDSLADISRTQELIDYRPEYTLQSGLQETIQWFRSN
jgi:nucleoside-diphosphate-sugar epimerase